MGWIRLRDHWLNLSTVVFLREVKEEGQHIVVVQVGVTVADPAGKGPHNDGTGLLSFLYFGRDAERILRRTRL